MKHQLPRGIKIIANIFNRPGVSTLEGTIGPLIFGDRCQSHFIEMQAGMFCDEHAHDTESIIYTARGRWVLCSRGTRHLINPGTLFWFGPNVPTGYEVPFDESAYLLIFKGQKLTATPEEMTQYLKALAGRLEEQQREGTPFSFAELPEDHPARLFARKWSAAT
jgi:quercetin dioxygenase-like cupin family protein